ncbi:Lymphoid-restricted membrane protein [Dissostichus eleginoides]|uniref:Lymphoid-restricted membrane protein n=1 Tax=Dissostichus eleginoides TaxID=100907 RepID=A0AAD9CCS0_DISEL|nr:Lymphoid-restricted membrane protein [Dissostichus eleginoides]
MFLTYFQPDAETNSDSMPMMLLGSDDSDEESSEEEPAITIWNELSIIERVGLNSVDMSEKDLETAFSQIAIAFSCDQYTLKQRLQAEEHARNLAEENIHLELTRGRETVEGLCLDSKRSKILQRLELSLDILGGTVERISNTAEVLGAVHQEARVSRAVELMVAHVENVKRRHDRTVLELEETRSSVQPQTPCRNLNDPRASPELEESDGIGKISQPNVNRRRVSITLIHSQSMDKIKRDVKKRATRSFSRDSFLLSSLPRLSLDSGCPPITSGDAYSVDDRPLDPGETLQRLQLLSSLLLQTPAQSSSHQNNWPPERQTTKSINSPLDTLRQRHKGKAALSKKKADKDKKKTNVCRQLSISTCTSVWRKHPLALWLYRCRWALCCMYLFVLLSVVTLTYILWKNLDEAPQP